MLIIIDGYTPARLSANAGRRVEHSGGNPTRSSRSCGSFCRNWLWSDCAGFEEYATFCGEQSHESRGSNPIQNAE